MKYCLVTLFVVYAVSAAPSNEKEEVQAAQFGMGPFNPYMGLNSFYGPNPMGMYNQGPSMGMGMGMGSDIQDTYGAPLNPDKYLKMKDEEFAVDYSLPCSNSCGCRQACMIVWWQPCTCRCPPPCGCVGCIWGCCKDRCCEDVATTTTTTTTTTKPVTTSRAPDPPTTTENNCNGGSCCKSCSCFPCMLPVFWMCPPPCGGGCCNSGGGSNCCNSRNRSCCGK